MSTHFGVYAIIVDGDKVLVVRKSRGPYTGLYDLPGGCPETGESDNDAFHRELMEEVSAKVSPDRKSVV